MLVDKLYTDESLSLSALAAQLDLSPHQLSELINTEYGFGSRHYLKGHRLRAAKQLLLKDVTQSVLAISIDTGFKSQSAFYAAFKELEGVSPGSFRKQNA